MENWRVKQRAEGESLTEVKILRGIFQGDSLSPLLFVISTMPLDHLFRKWTSGFRLHKVKKKSTT